MIRTMHIRQTDLAIIDSTSPAHNKDWILETPILHTCQKLFCTYFRRQVASRDRLPVGFKDFKDPHRESGPKRRMRLGLFEERHSARAIRNLSPKVFEPPPGHRDENT